MFHLGDFCFQKASHWKEIRNQLNGHIILIVGNHDYKQLTQGVAQLFDFVTPQMRITIGNRVVYLNHFPFLCFAHGDPSLYSANNIAYQLFGHVHSHQGYTGSDANRLPLLYPNQYDVGVDNNDYKPIAWSNIDNLIRSKLNGSSS